MTSHSPDHSRSLLRARSAHGHHKVSFVELFFDLVFVFAITQLSHALIAHFSLLGAVETLMLMLAVWWVWIFTSWVTNWLDPEKRAVRCALLVMMLLGLVLSSSLPKAFESRGLVFAAAYVLMQVGRTVFFLWAVRGHSVMVRNFQRILVWLAFSGVLWLAGGLADVGTRIALWAVALVVEYLGPSMYFRVPGLGRSTTADWDVEGGHMAERCALFIIIALGESILVTGATFSELEWTASTVAAFVVSLVGSITMWWLYFDTTAEAGSHVIASSDEPGRLARLAYTYIHLFMVAGIIAAAVADEFVLHHPDGHADNKTMITVLCSTALFLIGNLLFKWAITGCWARSHVIGLILLALLVPVACHLSPVVLSLSATLVLIGMSAWEHQAASSTPHKPLHE